MKKKYKLGNELWTMIHKKAIKADNYKRKKKFIKLIKNIHDSIECSECKGHMRKYIEEEPLINYLDFENGLFVWSWKFHNEVNKRLKKDLITYKDAYEIYY